MITMKQFINTLEDIIVPFAEENTEGSYHLAKEWVRMTFATTKLPVTEKQITSFVNRVWDKTNVEVA